MALVTDRVPDLNYEYHTITIDSIGQDSANTFTCYLQQPLKNVVQARLMATRINTTADTKHCYLSIKELDTIFNDRASNIYEGQSSLSILRGSFASIVTNDDSGLISFKDNYNLATQYIDPIRRIDRLTINLRDQNGSLIKPSSPAIDNFIVLRFTCRKPNL